MNTPKSSQGKSGISVAEAPNSSVRVRMAEQIAQAEIALALCKAQAAEQGAAMTADNAFVIGYLAGWMERDATARKAMVTVN